MKIITFITCLVSGIISADTHAWWSFSLDEMSDRSGPYGQNTYQTPQQLRVIKDQDFSNYYVYIELEGIKPEEVDIQRQGSQISIRQMRGRMEETQSENFYRSYQSYSSFTRRLSLPPDADPDMSKMKRENKDNLIRVVIPKQVYHPQGTGHK